MAFGAEGGSGAAAAEPTPIIMAARKALVFNKTERHFMKNFL
jgi:hypothetical protein